MCLISQVPILFILKITAPRPSRKSVRSYIVSYYLVLLFKSVFAKIKMTIHVTIVIHLYIFFCLGLDAQSCN